MLGAFAALLVLAGMGWTGTALLRKAGAGLSPLESIAYGVPLGTVVGSLLILVLAGPFGLSATLVWIVAVASAAVAAWLERTRRRPSLRPFEPAPSAIAVVVFTALIVRWCFLFHSTLTVDAEGLWAGHRNVWGDWAQHLGDVTSFAYGDNFPPTHPRLAGLPFAYHYLTSVTAAAMVAVGMSPVTALPLHSFVLVVFTALGIYAFAKRLTGDATPAALALVLFFLGGGLGWTLTLGKLIHSHGGWEILIAQPWDAVAQREGNYRWLNSFFSLLYPQRSFLYGLPMGLLVVTLLVRGVDGNRRREFLVAGLVAGLLPFAHLGTLLSLALVTPFLFLFFPSKNWIAFFGAWVAVAVPQILVQQGGELGAAGAMRFHPGWVAGTGSWAWFWLKNLGAFIPLLALSLFDRHALDRSAMRVLWAFMPIFIAGNLVVFQPWDWDNSKILVYWFVAVCVLASVALTRLWRQFPNPPVRLLVIATILTMTLSGLLENLEQMLGRDRQLLLTREELGLAESVRRVTEPHAIFVAGLQHNHPVPMLAGRRVVTSYPGWTWSQGVDTRQRELRRHWAQRDKRAGGRSGRLSPDLSRDREHRALRRVRREAPQRRYFQVGSHIRCSNACSMIGTAV
jgi:hypothetical protein